MQQDATLGRVLRRFFFKQVLLRRVLTRRLVKVLVGRVTPRRGDVIEGA